MTDPAMISLPLGFHDWWPVWQATVLGMLTLVQEDVPTMGAALLAAEGHLPWMVGFAGCFLGIWIGDGLLYLMARTLGRPLLDTRWGRKWILPQAVARSELWFHQRGAWALAACRFVPGTRLPTFLAAGFLAFPWPRFFLVTGLAAGLWTLGIFLAAHWIGPVLATGLQRDGLGWEWLILTAIACLAWLYRTRRVQWSRWFASWARWRHWEFWPAPVFYAPVVLGYLGLALRHRSLLLPTVANPGLFTGGIVGESKGETLRDLMRTQPDFTAHAWLVSGRDGPERTQSFSRIHARHEVGWPCVLKPDTGQRGAGVKVVPSEKEAHDYLRQTDVPLLVQRYAPGPFEAGVFYCRIPGSSRGRIWAVTEKIFPCLTGDGQRTVEELIWSHSRARFQARVYLRRFHADRNRVLARDETWPLVQAGNHAQGCIFRDGRRLITGALEERIDEISRGLDEFFIGRYDVRYGSEDDLRSGRRFLIVELNGAAAEATNIYDANYSLWSAYRTLFRQWNLVFRVAAANRAKGHRPLGLGLIWRAWRRTSRQLKNLPVAD